MLVLVLLLVLVLGDRANIIPAMSQFHASVGAAGKAASTQCGPDLSAHVFNTPSGVPAEAAQAITPWAPLFVALADMAYDQVCVRGGAHYTWCHQ